MSFFSFKKAEHLGNHKKHRWFLLKSFEEKLLFSKLKENKTSLRSCSGEIQGQVLGAIGDRVKAQGQHNAGGDWKKSPSNICCSGTNTNRNTHLPPFVTFWTI